MLTRATSHWPTTKGAAGNGGGLVRLYVSTYPEDVSGLVLVDTVAEGRYYVANSGCRVGEGRPINRP